VAARMGGPSPETNARLRAAIERAKSQGLPKENTERAIARAVGGGDTSSLQEFLCEVIAPYGAALLIEGITDNKNRSLAEIKHILAEKEAKLAQPGSLIWSFEKIGTIEISETDNQSQTKEGLELSIIDAGANDFKKNGAWLVETNFAELEKVRQELEKRGVKINEVGHDYKPKNALLLSPEQKKEIEPLLDKLLEHDDVQEVYTNFTE